MPDLVGLLCRFSLSVFTAIFPGGPELAGTRMSPFSILLEIRMMKVMATAGAIEDVI